MDFWGVNANYKAYAGQKPWKWTKQRRKDRRWTTGRGGGRAEAEREEMNPLKDDGSKCLWYVLAATMALVYHSIENVELKDLPIFLPYSAYRRITEPMLKPWAQYSVWNMVPGRKWLPMSTDDTQEMTPICMKNSTTSCYQGLSMESNRSYAC